MTNLNLLKNPKSAASSLSGLLALALFGLALSAHAEGVGTVTHLSGTLSATRGDGTKVLLSTRSAVNEGDLLATVQGTYARIKFNDGAEVVLRPESQLKVEKYQYAEDKPENDSVFLSMLKGGLRKVTGLVGKRNRANVTISAPNATIGIRGTHFGALFCNGDCSSIPTVNGKSLADGLHVDVVDGAVELKNKAGAQLVHAGQFAHADKDATRPPQVVPPSAGVRVTMPPVISKDSASRSLDKNNSDDKCTVQ